MLKLTIEGDNLTRGQYDFLSCASRQVLLAGGYGAGKTAGLALKLLQLKAANPDAPGLLVAPTSKSLKAVTLRRLFAIIRQSCGNEAVPKIVDPMGEYYLDFGDGVPIFLRGAERPDSIDGLDVGWVCGDELRYWRKAAYDTVLGRVRFPCPFPQSAFATTPAMGWLSDEYNSELPDRTLIVSGTRENASNLAPGFIENLRLSYSKRMQRAVIDGMWVILSGSVFEEFNPDPVTSEWIVDWYPTKRDLESKRVMLAVDPGFRRSAWAFIIERAPMDWVVFKHLSPDDKSDMQCVEMVNELKLPIDEIWCDPAGASVQSVAGLDTFTMLRNIKPRIRNTRLIRSITKFRSISFGVDKMRVLLGGDGYPIRLKFSKRVSDEERGKSRGPIKSLASLRYSDAKEGKAISDVPVEDPVHSHFGDCMRYWSVGMWLTDPSLRSRDPVLMKEKDLGYNIAT